MASFNSAFAAARKAGKKEFSWNGKRYNTKLASDKKPPLPKPRTSKPTPNPKRSDTRMHSTADEGRKTRARASDAPNKPKGVRERVGISVPYGALGRSRKKYRTGGGF